MWRAGTGSANRSEAQTEPTRRLLALVSCPNNNMLSQGIPRNGSSQSAPERDPSEGIPAVHTACPLEEPIAHCHRSEPIYGGGGVIFAMTLTSEFLERSVPVVTSRGSSRHRGEPGKSAYFPETPGCGASGWSSVRGGPESLEEGVGAFADCKVTAVVDRVQGPSEPRTGLLGDPEARDPVIPGPYERNGHARSSGADQTGSAACSYAAADLERELGELVLDCSSCERSVHSVSGLGVSPGHWAHREPTPHGEPVV